MTEHFDRIVIGGGAMGLATTWQLEARSGRQLLTLCGLVTHGDPDRVRSAHDALEARGAATELITAEAAAARWPGMRFEGAVLVNRDAGRIHAATALEVLAQLAEELGATLRYEQRVVAIEEAPDRVTVSVAGPSGEPHQVSAPGVVVTAGAWSAGLLDGLPIAREVPPLRVTEEHPAHFAVRPGFDEPSWPSFNHLRPRAEHTGYRGTVYGMLTPGEGVKVGFHATGDEVDPDQRRFRAPDAARAQLRDYVAEWFPGLDADTAVEVSCTYTTTPSERFVLDRRGRVTVGAGFSGQGFKFVPAIGRVLADASTGVATPPEAFRLGALG